MIEEQKCCDKNDRRLIRRIDLDFHVQQDFQSDFGKSNEWKNENDIWFCHYTNIPKTVGK